MDHSAQQLWQQILEQLRPQLSPPTFETWLQTVTPQSLNNHCLVICAPNPFSRNWLQKYYLPLITKTAQDLSHASLTVQITTPFVANANSEEVPLTWWKQSEDHINSLAGDRASENTLSPKHTFSDFVVGPNNRMAHAASLAVAEYPGREFNPLFICGGVGLGKTHLLQAIGHYRLELYPQSKVFYVSTEQFTNDLINAIRHDQLQQFREHYRAADILLIDDIQFIEGKEYTQEEFFHTFNTLYEAGKQVVLASDRPPKQIPSCSERLSSRFAMGLIADIQPPDLETRMAILQKKAESDHLPLSPQIVEYLAKNYPSNIRELEGALTQVVAHLSLSGLPLTLENVTSLLNPPQGKRVTSPEQILQVVSEYFQVSVADLKGSSRRREISSARQIGMYLMRQHTNLSLPRIGEVFGGKDHTTVMYSCEKIAQQQEQNPEFNQILRQLSDRVVAG
ncbi:chromosomal replication initiator protein DnaA [Halothece sp. PCC 7418]|uniref:chromosomal replication initiator protein DnaA n=1 Tax=Halothece sp. (strain PCC 7418) TaxID=65093 RepID=UPI0002A0748E|nr:chromosomal replication initiator protein DnaA [Halothece sp. PCC 7418]AFZ42263.1 chromosomal replication initiator protein DnaA [Halothece sp. PCC 7418]